MYHLILTRVRAGGGWWHAGPSYRGASCQAGHGHSYNVLILFTLKKMKFRRMNACVFQKSLGCRGSQILPPASNSHHSRPWDPGTPSHVAAPWNCPPRWQSPQVLWKCWCRKWCQWGILGKTEKLSKCVVKVLWKKRTGIRVVHLGTR